MAAQMPGPNTNTAEEIRRRGSSVTGLASEFCPIEGSGVRFIGHEPERTPAIRFNQRRFADAAELFRELLHLLESSAGGEHPSLVVPLNNFATSLTKLRRLEDAAGVYQRGAVICSKTPEGDHPTCGVLFENYASVLRKLGRKREAKEMAARSRQIELASGRHNGVGSVVSLESLRSNAN